MTHRSAIMFKTETPSPPPLSQMGEGRMMMFYPDQNFIVFES